MRRPRVEVENGIMFFVFDLDDDGNGYRFPCTHEGATEFVLELVAKLEALKHNPELIKTLGTKAVSLLVDLFVKKG